MSMGAWSSQGADMVEDMMLVCLHFIELCGDGGGEGGPVVGDVGGEEGGEDGGVDGLLE